MLNVVGFWPECSIIWFLCPLLQDMYQFHEVNRTCCIFYQYKWCHSEDFCVYEPGVYTSMLYCINHVHLVVDILDQRVWVHFPFLSTCVPVYLWWLIILEPFYWAFWYMLGLKNHCQYYLSGMVFLTCSVYKCWWTFFLKIFYKELFSFACVSGAYVTISIVSIYVVLCIVLKYFALE